MTDYWRVLQESFDELCVLGPERRRQVLDERLHDDEPLRSELERLLRAYDDERAANREAASAGAGRRFGAWQATEFIARGGMGEVWLAQRADGQHEQRAALKILSPYLAAPDSVDRFRRERQTLARLDHPNIAHLLDGGLSPQGEPFLVMEFVEGVRIDRYCEDRALAVADRLQLMIKVCAAVHAAHQYFIVHRDLKPSNVLVNRSGEPKLVDFGIAKFIDSESAVEQTTTANLFLTPAYACPEVLRGQPATVASDIYALGVMLYELLAGRRPFDAAKLGPAGMLEAITTEDAPRPSEWTRRPWKALVEGDLDAIVLKALARNPQDRYASAAELAADLNRYLAGEPVIAVPPSGWYIARTFVRRNRAMVAAAAVVVLSLAAGLAGTLWQAHVARLERLNAEQRFNDARKLANFVLFDLYDSVGKVPGAMPVQAEMAHQGLLYLDRLAAFKSSDPQLRLELAQGYIRLGSILGQSPDSLDSLGDNKGALESDRKALAILESLSAERSGNLDVERALASARMQLGYADSLTGSLEQAFVLLRKAADSFERIADAHPGDVRSLQQSGQAWRWYGKQLSEKGGYVSMNPGESRQYLDKSAAELESALRLDPSNRNTIWLLTNTRETMARSISLGDPAGGIRAYKEAFSLFDRLPATDQRQPRMERLRAVMLTTRGWCHGQLGEFAAGLDDLEQAVSIHDRLFAGDPRNAFGNWVRMSAYRTLGLVEGYAGHKAQSLDALETGTAILDSLVQIDPANKDYAVVRAEMQRRVANLLADAHRIDEARPFAEASIAYLRKVADGQDATPQQLIEAIRSTAECAIESLRDYPAALEYAIRARQLTNGKDASVLGYVSEAYGLTHDYPKAIEAARQGLALSTPKPGSRPNMLQKWLMDQIAEYSAKAAHR